jgi:hypothetical protein
MVNATVSAHKTALPSKVKSLLFQWLQVELNFRLIDIWHRKRVGPGFACQSLRSGLTLVRIVVELTCPQLVQARCLLYFFDVPADLDFVSLSVRLV